MGRPKKNTPLPPVFPGKKVSSLPDMPDILTTENSLWDLVLKRASRFARVYGFNRIETPLVEDSRLYEQFLHAHPERLKDLAVLPAGSQPAVIRPDILPSVLRAYGQHKVSEQQPLVKWFYSGFAVQKNEIGNLVSEYEFGYEIIGNYTHLTEAQTVSAVWEFYQSLNMKDLVLEINHIGNTECQRAYEGSLQDFLHERRYDLCDACNEHLKGRVMNILRCSNLDCQAAFSEAPTILDFLDPDSHKHFTSMLEALDELRIPYQLNPYYVGQAGLSRTNWVLKCKGKNQMVILGEGGSHDDLMYAVTGKNFCSFGFRGSLSLVHRLLEASRVEVEKEILSDVFLVPLGELAAKKSLRLFRDLTSQKVSVYDHFGTSGVKNQLKVAETYKAPIALIMGQKEAIDEMVILRDVKSGMQEIISYDKIVEEVKKRLGK